MKYKMPNTAKCKKCKTKFDLPTLRERKDYKPGICPLCQGNLISIWKVKK